MRKRKLIIPAVAAVAALAGVIALAERGLAPAQEATRLKDELQLNADSILADVGAGSGSLTIALARLFDGRLRLYATELGAEKMTRLHAGLEKAGVSSVSLLRGGERHPNLPGACCDAIVLRRVYHHLEHRADFNAGLYDSIRPDGRIAIIDFAPSAWRFWMPRHGIAPDVAEREMAAAGFVKVNGIPGWSLNDYCLIFRRAPRGAAAPRQ